MLMHFQFQYTADWLRNIIRFPLQCLRHLTYLFQYFFVGCRLLLQPCKLRLLVLSLPELVDSLNNQYIDMAITTAKLQKAISEILDESNLDEITTKKVREQLETKLGVNLADRRKEVDKLIMDTLEEKRTASEEEEEEEESEEEEKKPAKRGRKAAAAKNGSDSGSEEDFEPAAKKGRKPAAKGKAKKAAGGGGGRKAGTGYTKECKLSAELAAVMGQPTMARHEVVKQMWKLIKEKNLYDPKNKQFAICNAELLPVFGVKRFRTFGMMKYLKTHFLAD